GFAHDRKVNRWSLWRRIGEKDLMRQRGFAATGRTDDDIEGQFGQAAAQDFIEAAHPGLQLADHDFARLPHVPFGNLAFRRAILFFHSERPLLKSKSLSKSSGQTSRTIWSINFSPMN